MIRIIERVITTEGRYWLAIPDAGRLYHPPNNKSYLWAKQWPSEVPYVEQGFDVFELPHGLYSMLISYNGGLIFTSGLLISAGQLHAEIMALLIAGDY